jgi:hypothetical protein
MRAHSIYEVVCLCGHTVSSETKTATCSKCGIKIKMVWPCEKEPIECAG